jgi:hypothetical protein
MLLSDLGERESSIVLETAAGDELPAPGFWLLVFGFFGSAVIRVDPR